MKDEKNELKFKDAAWTFAAGSATRIAELPLGHALERVRVWINVNPLKTQAIDNIYHSGGVKGFYSGLPWNMVAATLKTGIRWVNISTSDKVLSNFIPAEYKVTKAVLIGVSSAVITTTLSCPFEQLKVLSMTKTKPYSLFSLSTYANIMHGWRPMFAKEVTISVMFNTIYANFLKLAIQYRNPLPVDTIHLAMVGAASGAICAVITTPLDMVKDQMQMDKGLHEKRLLPAAIKIYEKYGFFSMVRSMPVKTVRSAWYFGATTLLMDKFKALPQFMKADPKEHVQTEASVNSAPNKSKC